MKFVGLEKRLSDLGKNHERIVNTLFLPAALLLLILLITITGTLLMGLSVWGVNIPVAWGLAIVNFVWWIGIGHAGTFISAILLLARQPWRNSINRLAETMTLFAVASAGIFPLLHMGRPWYAYWLFPYPNDMTLYPNYRSPLTWDAFAVSTYALVSFLFWYVGLIPDFAIARQRSQRRSMRWIFAALSLGFSGEIREWATFKQATLILAILATPLVISVHTIVSLDFAAGINPGWHVAMFPPFFVAGAIYSGFAMMIIMLVLVQWHYKVADLITDAHLDKCARMLLLSGVLVSFFYVLELFFSWYVDEQGETRVLLARVSGEKAWAFWTMMVCNVFAIQLFWVRSLRRNKAALIAVSVLVLIGMWMERYVIVVVSLMESGLPSVQGHYEATLWDWGLYLGSFGLFLFGVLTVLRFVPFIPIEEVKEEIMNESL